MVARKTRNPIETRARILEAAADAFARDSYENVGLRGIAGRAGCDAALILRYFASKERLFLTVVETTLLASDQILGDKAHFGTDVAQALLGEQSGRSWRYFQILLRAVVGPSGPEGLDRLVEDLVMEPIAEWLGGEAARLRAKWIMTLTVGISMQAMLAPPARVLDAKAFARFQDGLARALQRLVDGDTSVDPMLTMMGRDAR